MGQAPPAPSCEHVARSGLGWRSLVNASELLEVTRDRRAGLETPYPWTRPASPIGGGTLPPTSGLELKYVKGLPHLRSHPDRTRSLRTQSWGHLPGGTGAHQTTSR